MGKVTTVSVTCDGVVLCPFGEGGDPQYTGIMSTTCRRARRCGKPVDFPKLAECLAAEKLETKGWRWQPRLYFCSNECAQPEAHQYREMDELKKVLREGEQQ